MFLYDIKTKKISNHKDKENKIFPDCCKNQKCGNKAVDNYAHALEFDPGCYKSHTMCNKAINTYPYTKKIVILEETG